MEKRKISKTVNTTEFETLIPYKKEEQCDFVRSLYYQIKAKKLQTLLHKVLVCNTKNLKTLKIDIQNELRRIK